MPELVPIKVKIGLRSNGHADHPDWYKLPLAKNEEPATDMFYGWKYDNTSGHKESAPDSPYGMQWGMVFVTPQFAQEAVSTFPGIVTIMTEVEAQDFWENKHTVDMLENNADTDLLQALRTELELKKELGQDVTELKMKIAKALDPNDVEPGIRKNELKKWVDAKIKMGLSIKQ